MSRITQKEFFYYNIHNKITSYIETKLNGNYNDFIEKFPDLNTFLHAFQLDNIMSHQFDFNNNDYKIILENISKIYQNNNENINENTKPKIKKRLPEKKIAGFVDILIISFITGTFIGIILLNIYSKIIEHI